MLANQHNREKKALGPSVPARLGVKATGKINGFFIKMLTTSSNFWSAFCGFCFNPPFLTKASMLLRARMNIYRRLIRESQVTASLAVTCARGL